MRPSGSQAHRSSGSAARGWRLIALGVGAVVVLALTSGAVLGAMSSSGPGPIAAVSPDPSAMPTDQVGIGVPSAMPSATPSATTSATAPTSSPSLATTGTAPTTAPVTAGPFAGDLMIADRQNGRILIVDQARNIRWKFPVAGSLPAGQAFAADDAFLSPDGKTIVANEEMRQVIVRIDIATRRIVWEYGRYGVAGSGPGELNTPDDAYPLANGDVVVADIGNCRIIQINHAKHITRQWGTTGVCRDNAPRSYGSPNGDTPLPDGGLLITEIKGSRVVRLDKAGHVVFDIHVPTRYPSDAHLDAKGNILVVDYSNPGAIIRLDVHGHVLWRYAPRSGIGRLDHPSLAIDLTSGLVAVNDDFRHRVLIIDPKTNRIVWQYGHTDTNGRAKGYLFTPDGIDQIPPAIAATL